METEFEENRSERRSFYCPNKMWEELQIQKKVLSVSDYIRQAIREKIERDRRGGIN